MYKFGGGAYECGRPDDGPLGSSLRSTERPRMRFSRAPQRRTKSYLHHHLLIQRLGPVSEVKRYPRQENTTHHILDMPDTVHRHLPGIDTDNSHPSSPYHFPTLQVYLGKLLEH